MIENQKTEPNSGIETDAPAQKIDATTIKPCCQGTIDLHSARNPMMGCAVCQQIIKWFDTRDEFDNYLLFCRSRNRSITTGYYAGKYVVIFNSYNA